MPWQTLLETRERLPVMALDDWYAALLQQVGDATPFALALLGGRLAATPGLAFLAGYQGALRALWPAAPRSLGALCVTENRSTRPADMQTRLDGLQLTGRKDFVTAAEAADWLLVGDGWDAYAKPFRSIEDLHVLTALVAWLYGVAQESGWAQTLQLRVLGLLTGCAEVSRLHVNATSTHVLLAGLFAQFAALRPEIDAAMAVGPTQWAALWQRDCNLLDLARTAREKRLSNALHSLGLASG